MILKYLFIFAFFSFVGWILELCYRSIINKKFINPGFLTGCVIPLYGFGAIFLNILCSILVNINSSHKTIIIFVASTLLLTLLELITGKILIGVFHVKLWDYSNLKINYQGIICPLFSLIWGVLALLFYLFVFSWLNNVFINIINNNIVVFILGIYYGIFLVDLCISIDLLNKLTKYSKKIKKIINIEKFKIDSLKNSGKRIWNKVYPYTYINKFLKDKIKK